MVAKEAFYIYDLSYLQVNVCNILDLRFTNAKKNDWFHMPDNRYRYDLGKTSTVKVLRICGYLNFNIEKLTLSKDCICEKTEKRLN